jgi:hypothetical protein
MSGYRRNSYRRGYGSRSFTPGRVARVNARPGPCRYCGEAIPAGAGQLWREDSGAWSVVHAPAEWSGSPVSGRYIGGCPRDTDAMNAEGNFGGPGARSESERLAAVAATYAAMHDAPRQAGPGDDLREVSRRAGSKYAYTSTGARMTMSSQRCEDAPCCGCCD